MQNGHKVVSFTNSMVEYGTNMDGQARRICMMLSSPIGKHTQVLLAEPKHTRNNLVLVTLMLVFQQLFKRVKIY